MKVSELIWQIGNASSEAKGTIFFSDDSPSRTES